MQKDCGRVGGSAAIFLAVQARLAGDKPSFGREPALMGDKPGLWGEQRGLRGRNHGGLVEEGGEAREEGRVFACGEVYEAPFRVDDGLGGEACYVVGLVEGTVMAVVDVEPWNLMLPYPLAPVGF